MVKNEQTPILDQLAATLGVWLNFVDPDTGLTHIADAESKRAICQALGYPAQTEVDATLSLNRFHTEEVTRFVPFVRVVRKNELNPFKIELTVPESSLNQTISWILTCEDGTTQSGSFAVSFVEKTGHISTDKGEFEQICVSFALSAPLGYHDLSFLSESVSIESNTQMRLIVVPDTCYLSPRLMSGKKLFGIPLQVYALTSEHNWGMGDLTDLKNFKDIADKSGAAFVGINPISALFADSPNDASPYFVSSREFLNPLYIDTDAAPEAVDSTEYAHYKTSDRFVELLVYTKESDVVEYEFIAEMKYTALGFLFDTFKAVHLNEDGTTKTARGKAFQAFCQEKGDALNRFALFSVLRSFYLSVGQSADWRQWEEARQYPDSLQNQSFVSAYQDSITFIKYQQFLAFEQLKYVTEAYRETACDIGLYTDLPVGVSLNSAEVWSNQQAFLKDVTVGAPPDLFNANGQDWSLAAFNPFELKKQRYEPFVRLLSDMMQFSRAVRLDHAFFLMRLFLRVKNGSGAYLSYSFSDLSGILALESVRHQCVVVAEDLGTPPPQFHDLMRHLNTLSFRLFRYETDNGFFKAPDRYDRSCLVTTGSHDLPTFSAFWKGLDIELMHRLNLILPLQYEQGMTDRGQDRLRLVQAFLGQGLSIEPDSVTDFPVNQVPAWLMPNTYAYLGVSNAAVVLVRLEDILEQDEQVNVPGTYMEYPNWRYKLSVMIEKMSTHPKIVTVMQLMKRLRPIEQKRI